MPGGDDDLFAKAMLDVVPLDERARDRVPAERAAPKPPQPSSGVALTIENGEGRAPGVSRKQLAALRSGTIAPEGTVDLHGLRGDAARQAIAGRIAGAVAAGSRCLLVIHGRGTHSQAGPVLASVVVDALSRGPAARSVLAFCPARPEDGGGGAMYVLLRRRR